jgi:hypothetical protein
MLPGDSVEEVAAGIDHLHLLRTHLKLIGIYETLSVDVSSHLYVNEG